MQMRSSEPKETKIKLSNVYNLFTNFNLGLTLKYIHTHIHIQIHLHNHNHIQAAASFKSFIRCTHNTNANKAPCQIKRNKRHPS